MRDIKRMKPKRNRDDEGSRLAAVAMVLALCVALALGIIFVVRGGGGRTGTGITAQQSTAPAGQKSSQPSSSGPSLTIEDVMVPPLSIYRRRNPFKPLVDMEEKEATVEARFIPSVGVPLVPVPTGSGRVVTVPPELAGGANAPGAVVSRAVTLERVFEEAGRSYACITVGDRLFEKVAVGDGFAENFKLLALGNDSSATVLYGDERFTIYPGQSIYW